MFHEFVPPFMNRPDSFLCFIVGSTIKFTHERYPASEGQAELRWTDFADNRHLTQSSQKHQPQCLPYL